eukprot:Phypoly_transcript_03225.p1 GENE.Phypoly_transcript_03225~~Phypoly_transcript_03225.p1  ORF type:complete len:786 (+),score=88.51 Phypoly_transcript_03225:55-2412(+)
MEEGTPKRIVHPISCFTSDRASNADQKREEVRFTSDTIMGVLSIPKTPITCFTISNFLTAEECNYYIEQGMKMGFDKLIGEYPQHYRNSTRCLTRSEELAAKLFERLKAHFRRSDVDDARPYGFNIEGKWIPVGLNDVFKLSCYLEKSHFYKHYDGCFVVNDDCRSIFTLLVYLNNDYQGGSTRFAAPPKSATVTGETGKAVIFNHDLGHTGNVVTKGVKFVMKTEVLFRRADMPVYPPRELTLQEDELYKEAVKLYNLADQLESNGDVLGSTAAYLKALEIQINAKQPPLSESLVDTKNDPTSCLSVDIYVKLFRYLDLKTAVKCMQVNRRWHKLALDGQIWMQKYSSDFPLLFLVDQNSHSRGAVEMAEKAFLKDWYQSYKISYLLNHIKYDPICIDIGATYTKAAQKEHKVYMPTLIGIEGHPHYMITGQGYDNNWRAGNDVLNGGIISDTMEPLNAPDGVDWDGLWLVLHSVYAELHSEVAIRFYRTYDKVERLNARLYPLILAEGTVPWDRKKLEHLVFKLMEVPSLCVVNSAVLSLYSIGRDTGVVVDFGRSQTTFTPVWLGEVLRDKIATFPIGTEVILAHFWDSVGSDSFGRVDPRLYSEVAQEGLRVMPEYSADCTEKLELSYHRQTTTNAHLRAPEIYFNTTILGEKVPDGAEVPSVVTFVYNSILACGADKSDSFFNCVLLTGGGAAITGLEQRFEVELQKLRTCKVIADQPLHSIVNGGVNYAKSTHYLENCRTRLEYMTAITQSEPPQPAYEVVETKVLGSLAAKFKNLFSK